MKTTSLNMPHIDFKKVKVENIRDQLKKLAEEALELNNAILEDDLINAREEAIDVIQVTFGILQLLGSDIKHENKKHIKKLEMRGVLIEKDM